MNLPESGRRRRHRWLLILIQVVTLLVVVLFFGWSLSRNWEELGAISLQYNGWLLAPAFLLLGIFFVLLILGWLQILRWMGAPLGLISGARIWFLSQLGKYVPGKVLMAVGRIYLAAQEGIAVPIALVSLYLEVVLLSLSGLLLYLVTWPTWSAAGPYIWFSLMAVPAGLVLLYPPWLERLINWLLRRLRREPIPMRLRYGQMLQLLVFYIAAWCVYGASQYCLIAAIHPLQANEIWPIMGMSSLAWVLGFLAFVTPAGLGVREGVQTLLLTSILPSTIATITPLIARLLWSLGEGLGVVVTIASAGILRIRLRRSASPDDGQHDPSAPAGHSC